jgi:hemerythrin-like metal-binding protein
MEWKDEYSVGIVEIDNQHKLLLRSFSVIEETMNLDQDWSNTHYAIVELIQLTRAHFSFEEALMRMFGYPETEAHQKDHQYIMVRLDSFERHSLNKSSDVEMFQFLQDGLMAHMYDSDKGIAKHIFSGAQVVKSSGDSS